MKYKTEIDKLLKDLLYEDWMSEDTYQDMIKLTFEKMDITKQKLSDDIEIGVKNGYTVNQQIKLIKHFLLNYNHG